VAEVVENWFLDTMLALLVYLDILEGVHTCFSHGKDPQERAMAFCPGQLPSEMSSHAILQTSQHSDAKIVIDVTSSLASRALSRCSFQFAGVISTSGFIGGWHMQGRRLRVRLVAQTSASSRVVPGVVAALHTSATYLYRKQHCDILTSQCIGKYYRARFEINNPNDSPLIYADQ
jgi:hypothetical protein